MILLTKDGGPSGLAASIGLLERQMADMRGEIEVLHTRIRNGELDEIRNASRLMAEIRQWLKLALEAEVQFEKFRTKEDGIVREYALDFTEARESIRGRLARLGRGGGAG